jgi:hypothetical protein
MHTKFWLESLKRRDPLEVIGIDGRIILQWILGKYVWRVWNGFIWLRKGAGGKVL